MKSIQASTGPARYRRGYLALHFAEQGLDIRPVYAHPGPGRLGRISAFLESPVWSASVEL